MNVVDRAKNLLLAPKAEWPAIAAEPHTVQDLYTGYVMILAAIAPIASFIGYSLVGFGGFGGFGAHYRIPIGAGIAYAVLSYVLTLASVYVLAWVIDALAPTFGGTRDFMSAFKVAAFAPTAAWLAGIFSIVPALGVLGILGLYSVYLLYLGLPGLMKVAPDKAVPYLVVVIIAAIVISIVIVGIAGLAIPSPVRGF